MGTGRITVTPTGIEVTDADGCIRMRMGAIGDEPVARARLYVHGKPGLHVECTSDTAWQEAVTLRKAYGFGYVIYRWCDSKNPQTEWATVGKYSWRYATPPKEIALANYLLEGE